jgi:hypothetical protein
MDRGHPAGRGQATRTMARTGPGLAHPRAPATPRRASLALLRKTWGCLPPREAYTSLELAHCWTRKASSQPSLAYTSPCKALTSSTTAPMYRRNTPTRTRVAHRSARGTPIHARAARTEARCAPMPRRYAPKPRRYMPTWRDERVTPPARAPRSPVCARLCSAEGRREPMEASDRLRIAGRGAPALPRCAPKTGEFAMHTDRPSRYDRTP